MRKFILWFITSLPKWLLQLELAQLKIGVRDSSCGFHTVNRNPSSEASSCCPPREHINRWLSCKWSSPNNEGTFWKGPWPLCHAFEGTFIFSVQIWNIYEWSDTLWNPQLQIKWSVEEKMQQHWPWVDNYWIWVMGVLDFLMTLYLLLPYELSYHKYMILKEIFFPLWSFTIGVKHAFKLVKYISGSQILSFLLTSKH